MSLNIPNYVKFHPWELPNFIEMQVKIDPEDMAIQFSKYKGFLISNIKKIDPNYFRYLYDKRESFYDKKLARALEYYMQSHLS